MSWPSPAVNRSYDQRLGNRAQAERVNTHNRFGRGRAGQAGNIQQRINRPIDGRHGRINRGRVSHVTTQGLADRSGDRFDVEGDDLPAVGLMLSDGCSTDARSDAGDVDAFTRQNDCPLKTFWWNLMLITEPRSGVSTHHRFRESTHLANGIAGHLKGKMCEARRL